MFGKAVESLADDVAVPYGVHVRVAAEWSSVCGRVRPAWNADVGPHVPRSPRQHSDAAEASSAEYASSAPPLWPLQGNHNSGSDETAQI